VWTYGGTNVLADTIFDTNTGGIVSDSAGVTSSGVIDVGEYWRCYTVVTNNDSVGNTLLISQVRPVDANTGSRVIWGWQTEQGAFPSPYIKTTAGIVVATADVASMSDVTWFNQSEGTFFVEARLPDSNDGAARTFLQIDDDSNSDRISLRRNNAGSKFDGITQNSGGNDGSSTSAGTVDANVTIKVVTAYAQDDGVNVLNGTLSGPDTSADLPTTDTLTTLRIGHVQTPSARHSRHSGTHNGHRNQKPSSLRQSTRSRQIHINKILQGRKQQ